MQLSHVVLLQRDIDVTESMAASLSKAFSSIDATQSIDKLQRSIAERRPAVVIVDLEMISINDVKRLCTDFSDVKFICTHRLADDEMWTQALGAGAVDVCPSFDVGGIASSALRNTAMA